MESEGDPVYLHGIKIGRLHLEGERQGQEIVIKARLAVDWPGLWHAAAVELDEEGKR
jgi:hypothetical protein